MILGNVRNCRRLILRVRPLFHDHLSRSVEDSSLRLLTYGVSKKLLPSTCADLSFSYKSRSYATEEGSISKFFQKLSASFSPANSKMKASGFNLYAGLVAKVDYDAFFKTFALPDTFFSWFLITELHVWMLAARLMSEGNEGRQVRNALIEAMWLDVDQRSKKLGNIAASARREQVQELNTQFHAALFAYDEGVHGPDHVLAGAVWRTLLSQNLQDSNHLPIAVAYIREQLHQWEDWSLERFMKEHDQVHWTSLTSA